MPVPIHLLLEDQPPLVTVSSDATLLEALRLMRQHEFSQLPVVDLGRPLGRSANLVTSDSILHSLDVFRTSLDQLRVKDATVAARTIMADEDLFSKMDDLLDSYAVLILNADGSLAGILTNHDTSRYFRRRAEEMLLVEDIETTLKDHLRTAYGTDESSNPRLRAAIDSLGSAVDTIREDARKAFRRFCGQRSIAVTESDLAEYVDRPFLGSRGERQFDDLNLSDYIQLARRPDAWRTLSPVFGIPERAFLEMLEGVRKTRNKLMHFRPDIDASERKRLRFCADWFKNHPPLPTDDQATDASSGEETPEGENRENGSPNTIEYVEDSLISDGEGESPEVASVEAKYAPLASHLAEQPRGVDRITLTFPEIERLIAAPLPEAAREHRSWWTNDAITHVHSRQWLEVSWRVVSISMTDERVVFARAKDRDRAYIGFFGAVKSRLREIPGFPLAPANPLGSNWLPLVNFPPNGRTLVLSFARGKRLRLECYIDTGSGPENEAIFEALFAQRERLEATVGLPLEWERLEGRRACRVALYRSGAITESPEQLAELVDWAVVHAQRFNEALGKANVGLTAHTDAQDLA
jgi:CBS domain-containing protein